MMFESLKVLFLPVLLAAVLACYVCHRLITTSLKRATYSTLPSPPLDNPWHGHAITMQTAKRTNTFLDLVGGWLNSSGKTIAIFVYSRCIVFTTEAAIMKTVLNDLENFSKANDLPNRSLYGQRITGWNSVLTGGGQNWGIKRKMMSRFFAKANMMAVFDQCKPIILNHVRCNLMNKVGAKGMILDLHQEMTQIFSAFPAALGLKGFDTSEVIARNVTKILEMIPKQLGDTFTISRLRFGASKEKIDTTAMVVEMRARIKAIVQEKFNQVEHQQDDEIQSTDVLGQLVAANKACDFERNILMEYVVDDVMTIYLVMDNMSEQLAALFISLSENPQVYTKMVTEIRNFELTDYASLSRLPYTERVILESLRYSPALLRGTRILKTRDQQPIRAGSLEIPSGTQIHFSQYLIHHDPEIWEDPDTFDPDRWGNGFSPAPYTYMPFLVGPRGCLGKHFAMLTMKLTLAAVLQKFELTSKFDHKKMPTIQQGRAIMMIKNRVDFEFSPLVAM